MTKFLNQKCRLERYRIDSAGLPVLNDYGEIQYGPSTSVKCRHESITKDIQTANGSILRSMSRYFFDSNLDIRTDYRVDGKVVIDVEDYVNVYGQVEGYEVYV